MNFVLINPYNFPIVHPPYGYFAYLPKNLLNLVEQEINRVGPYSIFIILLIFSCGKKIKKVILLEK